MPIARFLPAPALRLILFVCLSLTAACATRGPATESATAPSAAATSAHANAAAPVPARADLPLLLVSIDGFRADYLDRGKTPHLAALAAAVVRADALRPSFPSLTFPNHYTLVTGLYPDHHGIVHNRIEGNGENDKFVYNDASTTADGRWWGGEPIWVGAERQGLRSATMFWPGSDTAIAGVRPSYWKPFDRNVSPEERVDTVLGWLDLPPAQRPRFLTLYFEHVDRAGHDHGPSSPEVNNALAEIDAALGRLLDGLAARGLTGAINLLVVSDHGLAAASNARVVVIDDVINLKRVRAVNYGVVAGFAPKPGQQAYAYKTLVKRHDHMRCWRRTQMPARFHYGSNPRIPPIVCLADPGWIIARSDWLKEHADDSPRGEHGYDNDLPEMRALFIASGPSFRRGTRVPEFDNVDVYPLMAHLLHIRPAPNDGNPKTMRGILRDGG